MQDHQPTTDQPVTTQAADGYPRKAWTVKEVLRLNEIGFFDGDGIHRERVELIEGELVAMSPKGPLHENLRTALVFRWIKRCPDHLMIASESPVYLSGISAPEPDLCVYPAEYVIADVPPEEVILLVEVADSSSRRDHNLKAAMYAKAGIREYWVIDLGAQMTTIYSEPGEHDYSATVRKADSDLLTPTLAPELAVRMSDILARS
ncbi:MAG: Uma2 family endonuclease [Pseudomonadota bacterium]